MNTQELTVKITNEAKETKELKLVSNGKYKLTMYKNRLFQYENTPVTLQRIIMNNEPITLEEIKEYYGLKMSQRKDVDKGMSISVIRLVFQMVFNKCHIILIVDPETLEFTDTQVKYTVNLEEIGDEKQWE